MNVPGRLFTRRRLLLSMAASQVASGYSPGSLDTIAASLTANSATGSSGRYRADATVLFLGIPVLSRSAVGSGTILIEHASGQENTHLIGLRFAAGSIPERSRGLNRLGYIQEYIVERSSAIVESAYFGFMTSSKEENFGQAKAALGATSGDSVPYTAVEGSAGPRSSAWQLYSMLLPSAYNYSRCDEVVRHVRDALAKRQIKPSRQETTATETACTFLYAVRAAMRSPDPKITQPFLYNGKRYRLEVQKLNDAKMGQAFAGRKLTGAAEKVYRINGTIQNLVTHERTPFKVWYEQGRELPLRFEYKPRSFLNLAFEQVPA